MDFYSHASFLDVSVPLRGWVVSIHQVANQSQGEKYSSPCGVWGVSKQSHHHGSTRRITVPLRGVYCVEEPQPEEPVVPVSVPLRGVYCVLKIYEIDAAIEVSVPLRGVYCVESFNIKYDN